MVIAVPLPVVVKRHEEQVLAFEHVDDLRSVGRADDGVAQRGAEPAQNGGPRQELPDLAGWRLSTSSARKSTMNRLSPVNWRTKACGEG